METNKKVRLVLDLIPHASTPRARRIPNPDLTRLLDPRWWTKAIFGDLGGKDPLPVVVNVEVVETDDDPADTPPAAPRASLPFPEPQEEEENDPMFHTYAKMPEVLMTMADEGVALDMSQKPARLVGSNTPVHGKTVNALLERKLLKKPNKAGIAELTKAGEREGAELMEAEA